MTMLLAHRNTTFVESLTSVKLYVWHVTQNMTRNEQTD